jgi:putative addiction module component (TIGR02574 family)
MAYRSDQVLEAALALPSDERARLAHELLLSLDAGEDEKDVQAAWTEDLARRLREVRDGTVELSDLDEVDAYVAQKLAEAGG